MSFDFQSVRSVCRKASPLSDPFATKAVSSSGVRRTSRPRDKRSQNCLQPAFSQCLAHTLTQSRISTLMFSVVCTPLVQSSAPERKSTPLFSFACELFCKNTGGRGTTNYCYATRLAGGDRDTFPLRQREKPNGERNMRRCAGAFSRSPLQKQPEVRQP